MTLMPTLVQSRLRIDAANSAGASAPVPEQNPERTRAIVAWTIFACIGLLQWCMFRQYVEHNIAWAYPLHFDQLGYLMRTYDTFDSMQDVGIAQGLQQS